MDDNFPAQQIPLDPVPGASGLCKIPVSGNSIPVSGNVAPVLATDFKTGQFTAGASASGSPVAAATTTFELGVCVKCLSTSPETIFIGPTSGVTVANGYELAPGESIVIPFADAHQIFACGAAGTGKGSYLGLDH